MSPAVGAWLIIPARGGSKRLKGKNLLPIDGVPMIARAVNSAHASACFSRVIVSTDDAAIAQVAKLAGAEVPFIRPAELASDTASSLDALLHAVETLASDGNAPETIGLIQATSPLLNSVHVKEAMRLFNEKRFISLSSMKAVDQHPEWMFRLDEQSGRANPESPGGIVAASTSLARRYIENGAIYLVRRNWLLEERSLYNFSQHGCYVMSEADSIDIDNEEDFIRAQFEIARRKSVKPDRFDGS